ncbi:MAG: hypothetical protein SOW44_04525 [Porphyromonas sp.]|nr:hypothetical protein [Bacteroidales bacterium]MDY3100588.1 hypothetical protein [Porphyromonas sp.]
MEYPAPKRGCGDFIRHLIAPHDDAYTVFFVWVYTDSAPFGATRP